MTEDRSGGGRVVSARTDFPNLAARELLMASGFHAKPLKPRKYYRAALYNDEIGPALDEIDRLREWQAEACAWMDWLGRSHRPGDDPVAFQGKRSDLLRRAGCCGDYCCTAAVHSPGCPKEGDRG